MAKQQKTDVELLKTWTLSPAARLGSFIRAKGILQEIQARLPKAIKKSLLLEGGDLVLAMPADQKTLFNAAAAIVSQAMSDIENLPVIPREIEDILGMKTSERHRWLEDGRLPSAGTRTVRLAGRARRITFHVFDPRVVEELLNRGAVDEWRVEDAEAKAEKRRHAADQARLTRSARRKKPVSPQLEEPADTGAAGLRGWADFDLDGLLR